MNKCHTLINLYIYIWWVFESLLLWVWWPYPILWQPLGFVIATAIAAGDAACFAASCHSVHPPRKLLYLARQGTKQPSPRWYPSACPDQTPVQPDTIEDQTLQPWQHQFLPGWPSAECLVSFQACKALFTASPKLATACHCKASHTTHTTHRIQLCRQCICFVAGVKAMLRPERVNGMYQNQPKYSARVPGCGCRWNDLEVSVGRTKWCCFDSLLFWNSIMFMFFVLLIVYHFNSGV